MKNLRENAECFLYIYTECSVIGLTRRGRLVKIEVFAMRGSLPVGKRNGSREEYI